MFKTTSQSYRNIYYHLWDTKQGHTWIEIYIPSATNKCRMEEGLHSIKEYTGYIAAFQDLINFEALNFKDCGLDERWPLGIPAGLIYRFSKPCLPLANLGEDFRIEDCGTFTPTTSRIPDSFIDDLTNIDRLRQTNVSEGRLINHEMPFSEEKKDEMVARDAAGALAEELSTYFQRTLFSIVRRLEELGLIETDVQSSSDDEGDHLDEELPEGSVTSEVCDEPIPLARLEIFFHARLFAKCNQEKENKPELGIVFPPVPAGLGGKCPRCSEGVI